MGVGQGTGRLGREFFSLSLGQMDLKFQMTFERFNLSLKGFEKKTRLLSSNKK